MKKIAYVMHVDWNWIKQRPQYIAERLAKEHAVTVFYPHRYKRTGYQKRDAGQIRLKPVYAVPCADRFPCLRGMNQKLRTSTIAHAVKKMGADCLYLPFPSYVDAIPSKFTGRVIYDCMDNYPAFTDIPAERAKLEQQERALVERADAVLVSSVKLKDVLLERCGARFADKIVLVRNGYNGRMLENPLPAKRDAENYTLAYFGTISTWFDFGVVEKSLADFPNVHYLLMGPVDGVQIPDHERIHYIGTVEHKELPTVTADAQCLIMPFVRNEIIESVDPVKLYEYINFNKNILCVQYPEVERFAPFVHFYCDYESYKKQLEILMQSSEVKYSREERETFLGENSWESRVKIINTLL